jgi:hypothetical protein
VRFNAILARARQYYDEKLYTHGPTYKGADWNSVESQELRFEQLLKVCDSTGHFSLNDYGCGCGALVGYMTDQGFTFQYRGYDISSQMIAKAKELHKSVEHCQFFTNESHLTAADYTVASGIFNVKLQTSDEEWKTYVLHTLEKIAALSGKGFSFNVLTRYSDRDHMRSDLYYADPLFLFDYCKKRFSRFVSLLHDYPLYEFTILVRR